MKENMFDIPNERISELIKLFLDTCQKENSLDNTLKRIFEMYENNEKIKTRDELIYIIYNARKIMIGVEKIFKAKMIG